MIEQALGFGVSLGLIGMGLTFGGLAVGISIRLVEAYLAAVRSRTWLSTRGQITHSATVWVGARAKSPRPELRYTYTVGGTQYTGQRLVFEYWHLYTHAAAEQILREYPVGAPVAVYYNPNKPQESTLRQTHIGIVYGLVVSAMLLLPTGLCLAAGVIGFVEMLGIP